MKDDSNTKTEENQSNNDLQENEREQAQITNSILPPPPSIFNRFTRENIAKYKILKEAKEKDKQNGTFDWENAEPEVRIDRQKTILEQAIAMRNNQMEEDQMKYEGQPREREVISDLDTKGESSTSILPLPTWDVLLAMEPANLDWIKQDGFYSCFGDRWPIEESLPSLQEMGMTQIYPSSSSSSSAEEQSIDRPAILTSLLRTLLKSYLRLIDSVLAPPQAYLSTHNDPETGAMINQEWLFTTQDKAKQINDISINFMHLLNETRPLQAKEQLRDLMRDQLNNRKQETKLMRLQCKAMRAEIEAIRVGMRNES